jgi:valyl-tRNA synthetase
VAGDTKAAIQSSSSGQDSGTTPAAAKMKTAKELERERKKAEKQAMFDKKKAAQAEAATTAAKKTKEKEKAKKAEAEVLPPYVEDTPEGEKKRLKPFDDPYYSSYHPTAVESAWYAWWEKEGYFKPQFTPEGKVKPEGKFVIVVPPPNVTGALQ